MLPTFCLFSLFYTAWDPTYYRSQKARVQGRDVRIKGKTLYVVGSDYNSCKSGDSRHTRPFRHSPGFLDSPHLFFSFCHGSLHLGTISVSLLIRSRIVLAHIVRYHSFLNYWYVALSLVLELSTQTKIGILVVVHHPASTAASDNPPH